MNIPYTVEIDIDPNSRTSIKGQHPIYSSTTTWIINNREANVFKKIQKGCIQVLEVTYKDDNSVEILPITTKVDRIFYNQINVNALLSSVDLNKIGKYRDYDGPWHSDLDKYEVLGKHFANMQCYGHCINPIQLTNKS
jgi:hypothetical protein